MCALSFHDVLNKSSSIEPKLNANFVTGVTGTKRNGGPLLQESEFLAKIDRCIAGIGCFDNQYFSGSIKLR
jgi:hypothetical protein